MIKNLAFRKITIATLSLVIVFLIYSFPNKEMAKTQINYIDTKELSLYALDKDNLLGKINITVKKDEKDIESIINLLTINSLSSILLPNSFNGTIPSNTKLLNYDQTDNILTLNFSKEFLNSNDMNKTIESIIYSLCNDKINKITILIEDKNLNEYLDYPNIFDKSFGINKKYDLTNYKNTSKVTIYYIKNNDDLKYYTPITKITNENKEKLEIIVSELKKTPIYEDNLVSFLTAAYELKDYEIKNSSIELTFNNPMLTNLSDNNIKEEIIYTLSNSIKDTYNIDNILINFSK